MQVGWVLTRPGLCSLCGTVIEPGQRLYPLPGRWPGARGSLACHDCRYPDERRAYSRAWLQRKLAHRVAVGPRYAPGPSEAAAVLDLVGHDDIVDQVEVEILETLQAAVTGVPVTFGADDTLALCAMLDRVPEPRGPADDPADVED